ncbi:methylated-DNA--[protein]-cysteine S-methyltransferase [Clostridium sp. CS001]|uniref:methylated-DNA--[protein]-cysteine S-methyltransferase n=1 Tax=Clostridium sp. CS001 TaxID=2880648 RepID=UPI001CF47B9A|nr:methylated-DNA--[protein]-cysteine S-methyltransferase [Clostridium sp. CS001]MCB2288940.1 methylated-DNA--[protein]-cysteine S-methyltransferase [Clostridium sp. CS001]
MIKKLEKDLESKPKLHGYYNSPIGIIEITANDEAITSLYFVEEETMVPNESAILDQAIIQIDEYFKGDRRVFDLKCEFTGTDFQKKVWNELIKIPYGETLSYKELAIKIGNEKSTRAVGNANGKNAISIIVPCHRVIGSDKSLTGYAWGISRKQWLLSHEKSI